MAELVALQTEYQDWLDGLPDSIKNAGGPMVDRLEAIAALDLAELEGIEPPRGFGRD